MSRFLVALLASASVFTTVKAAAANGYTTEWTSSNAAADGDGYISSYADSSSSNIQDFTVQCGSSCDSATGCVFFNVYQELSDQPPANVCVLWSQHKPAASATNTFNGGKPISNSIGYKKGGSVSPEDYNLEWTSLAAAATGSGYISSFVSSNVFLNDLVSECAHACDTTTNCAFFNVYQELQSSPASNVCVLWNQDKPSNSATNSFNSGKPVSNSQGYLKITSSTSTSSMDAASTTSTDTRTDTASATNTASATSTATTDAITTSSTSTTSTDSTTNASAPTDVAAAGYTIEWTGVNSAADGSGYVSSYVSQTASYAALVADCASSCSSSSSCIFFNVYQELSDRPPANICVLWSQNKPVESASNANNNDKPISNSTGYSKNSAITTTTSATADATTSTATDATTSSTALSSISSTTTDSTTSTTTTSATATSPTFFSAPTFVPGYNQQWMSENAAADGAGYIRSFVLPSTISYASLVAQCVDACSADVVCAFVNTYEDMDNSGGPNSKVCVLWNQDKPSSSATNVINSGRPIMNSVGYVKNVVATTTSAAAESTTTELVIVTTSSSETSTTTETSASTTSTTSSTSERSTTTATSTSSTTTTSATTTTSDVTRSASTQTSSTTTSSPTSTTSSDSTTVTSTKSSTPSTTTSSASPTTSSSTSLMTTMITSTTSASSTSATSPASTPTITQLIVNGGFESGVLSPWVSFGYAARAQSEGARTGTYSAALASKSFPVMILTQQVEVVRPGNYNIEAWIQAEIGCLVSILIDGVEKYEMVVKSRSYGSHSIVFGAISSSISLRLQIFCPPYLNGPFYLDDVSMTYLQPA